MDAHAPAQSGYRRKARDLRSDVSYLVAYDGRLVRNAPAVLLADGLRDLPPLVQITREHDRVRVALVQHLDVDGAPALDEVADGHGALGRDRPERAVVEYRQRLLERAEHVLPRRGGPAVGEEVGGGCVGRVPRTERADVVLEGLGGVLRVLSRRPPAHDRRHAREVLLLARYVGRADEEDARRERVAGRLGEVGVLLAAERYQVHGDLTGAPHGGVLVAVLKIADHQVERVVPARAGVAREVEHDDLVAQLAGLVAGQLKHLRLAGRDDVPPRRHREVQSLKHL